jgi:hypothetical protein
MSETRSEQGAERLERAATWLSLVCAVHCLAVPAMAAGLPLAGASAGLIHHPLIELGLFVLVVAGASFTAFWGFKRHRDARILGALLFGLALYGLGHLLEPWVGSALNIAGALVLSVASLLSARLSHAHSHDHDETCAH